MARQQISLKQLAIDKDNAYIAIAVGVAAFVVIFSLVASKALLEQRAYQSKIITKKKVALKQLKTNVSEVNKLKVSYQAFADQKQNVIGGNASGEGDRDGDNSRIVLDALPSKYDYPALTTSLQKMFKAYKLEGITGSDDEVIQSVVPASATPVLVEIPFNINVTTSTTASKEMLSLFERSIRPIQINKLSLNANGTEIRYSIDAKTYFQPPKKFDVTAEPVKK